MLFQRNGAPPLEGPPPGIRIEWRMSVYALVRGQDGSILIVLPDFGNQWSLPGGKMEPEETFPTVIRREGNEETGFEIRVLRDVPGQIIGEEFFLTRKGHWCHSIHIIFFAELTRNLQNLRRLNPETTGERIRSVAWMKLKDLRDIDILPMFKEFLRRLKREAKIPETPADPTSQPGP